MKQIILIGMLFLTVALCAESALIATEQTSDYILALKSGEKSEYRSLTEETMPIEAESSWQTTPSYLYNTDSISTKASAIEIGDTLKLLYGNGYELTVRENRRVDVEMKSQEIYNYSNVEMPLVEEKKMMTEELRLRAESIVSQIDSFSGKIEFSHANVEETKCARCKDGRLKLKSVDIVFRRVMDGAIVMHDFVAITFDSVTLDVTNIRISWKEYRKKEELKQGIFSVSRISDTVSNAMSVFEQNKTGFATIDRECADNKITINGAAKVWIRKKCDGETVLIPGVLISFEAALKGCKNKAVEEILSLSQIYPLIESSECEKEEFDILL